MKTPTAQALVRAIEEVKADVQNTSLDGYAWPHEKNFNNGRYNAVNWIINRAHEIDASTPEQTDEARDAARLDSGCIMIDTRDEFGDPVRIEHRGMDLRKAIDAAMSAEGKGCE